MKKTGFTLSEVLLTLTIIGVVSAMTVPSLITSIEDKELASQAKKAYNTVQSAISMKYALTRQTPADMTGNNMFSTFLANPNNAPTLKTNDRLGNVVHLPDGQIMTSLVGTGATCGSLATDSCFIAVDVNGEDGPNLSSLAVGQGTAGTTLRTLNTAINTCPRTQAVFNRACRDIVYFEVRGMSVRPFLSEANNSHATTRRYFTGSQN